MPAKKEGKILVRVYGTPLGCFSIIDRYTTVNTVANGLRKIGIRLRLFPPDAPGWLVEKTFRECTILWKTLPDGRWVETLPDA